MLLATISITLALSNCSTDEYPPKKENYSRKISEYFENFNKHEWGKLALLYAENCETKDPSEPDRKTINRNGIINKYLELQKNIPDIKDSIVTIYDLSPCVIVEFISRGTDPSGKKFELPICTIFEFNNEGKIIKDFTYYDNF